MTEQQFADFETWWKSVGLPAIETLFGEYLDWEATLDVIAGAIPTEKNPDTFERRETKRWFDESYQNFLTLDEPAFELEHLVACYCRYRQRSYRQQAGLAAGDIKDFVASFSRDEDYRRAALVSGSQKPEVLPDPEAVPF